MNKMLEARQRAYLQAETIRLEPLFQGLDLTPGQPQKCPVCEILTPSWLEGQENRTILLLNIESEANSHHISLQKAIEKFRTTYTCRRDSTMDHGEGFTADLCGVGTTTFIQQPDGKLKITCGSPTHDRATEARRKGKQTA